MSTGSILLALLVAQATTVYLWNNGVSIGLSLLAFPIAGAVVLLAIAWVKYIVDTTPPKE